MKKEYYKINENGYAITLNPELPFNQRSFDIIWVEENEETPESYVIAPDTSDPTKPLWLPKWTGEEWIEGLPQEEIDELNKQPNNLKTEERLTQLEALMVNNISQQIENQILKGGL